MEHKVGETFQYGDVTLQVVACDGSLCTGCYFNQDDYCILRTKEDNLEACQSNKRKDKISIIFKQVNKDKMENLDLIKVLDGCPVDTEFYSDTFGVLRFRGIDTSLEYPLMFIDAHCNTRFFTPDGKFFVSSSSNCKLSIFPSDTQRDWSKFERFWDKPEVKHFDPKTFKPFDKVLVRDSDVDVWQCEMLSHLCSKETTYPYFCCGGPYYYCIPYNNETEHILGTSGEAPAFYRYWEAQS